MLLQAQPIFDALDAVSERENGLGRVILLDPAGKNLTKRWQKNCPKNSI